MRLVGGRWILISIKVVLVVIHCKAERFEKGDEGDKVYKHAAAETPHFFQIVFSQKNIEKEGCVWRSVKPFSFKAIMHGWPLLKE